MQKKDTQAPYATGGSRSAPPVTYTALQMLFGDTCAVYLMELKGLTQNQYAMNHPAGRIGKRLVLKVSDVMKPYGELPLVKPTANGMETLVHMAGTSKGCGCLLVVDDDRTLLGTFSDADLRRALTQNGEDVLELPVKDLMNFKKDFPRTTTANAMAFDAHLKMVGSVRRGECTGGAFMTSSRRRRRRRRTGGGGRAVKRKRGEDHIA